MLLASRIALAVALLLPLFGQEIPRKAPEYVVQTGNAQHLLSSYRGKVVLIEFLSTTCPHCQETARMISKLNTELGPKGFQPLGVAFNDPTPFDLKDFVVQNRVNYPVGMSSREVACGFMGRDPNARMTVPQLMFIDRKGNIILQSVPEGDSRWATEPELRKQIESMLTAAPEPTVKKAASKKRPT